MRGAIQALAVAASVLVGCGGSHFVGRYIDANKPGSYIEFHADGTAYAQEEGIAVAGSYRLEGESVILSWSNGYARKCELRGATLVAGNEIFTRQ